MTNWFTNLPLGSVLTLDLTYSMVSFCTTKPQLVGTQFECAAVQTTFTLFGTNSLLLSGNYSVYGLEIHLSRCVSPYLLNVYLPTAIFVVMSWVSFLIPTDVVPARIVLLVTLCLVIINTFNNVT